MTAMTSTEPTTTDDGQVLMQAVVQRRYGRDPQEVLRLERIPRPAPKDDEVLIRVRAAGVDRGTWNLMTGEPSLMRILGFGLRGPKAPVPGWAVAGTVAAAGPGVTGLAPGDEVFGTCHGSFAEYATAKASRLARKPASLSFEQAAALPNSATTALRAVRDHARLRPGQHVLVLGASGGVGTYVVQLAKARGAEVTGACRTSKMDLVAAMGADHVLDYTRQDVTAGPDRYDVIIDIGGDRRLAALRRALAGRGTLVLTGGEGNAVLGPIGRNLRALALSPFVSQRLTAFVAPLSRDDLETLADLAAAGEITPAIERAYPLSEAATALRRLGDGQVRGKLVISL